nr:hypothetical protein [Bacillus amyloliquefaciens]
MLTQGSLAHLHVSNRGGEANVNFSSISTHAWIWVIYNCIVDLYSRVSQGFHKPLLP